ncbi:MAG: MBL fold metallo-hydrolase [Phycisphaerae bacterium]|nr:MBL fold metallo-hydrolase [Phycisphaerae bacterium]
MSVRYRWKLLRAGEFRLDAGSMFGLIPRAVWRKTVETDDRARIRVQHNCLLLERADEPPAPTTGTPHPLYPDAPKLVVLEVGTGDKLDARSRDIFALGERSITDALHEADCRPEDIGAVFVSHLHFDHAGGLTRRPRPGETPDWTGEASAFSGRPGTHPVKVTFPSAHLYVQSREWDDALANRSVMTRTYFRDHLEPMKERVRPVDSPRPFPTGYTPDRDETPRLTHEMRRTEVLPGIHTFLVPGHTWGQQAVEFTDTRGRAVVFTPDVMPTAAHLPAAASLAYDVEPYTSMISKRWFLQTAAERDWLLVLDHEPANPLRRARDDGKGWYTLEENEA